MASLFSLAIPFRAFSEVSQSISDVKSFLENPPALKTLEFVIQGEGNGDNFSYLKDGKLYLASVQNKNFTIAELANLQDVPMLSPTHHHPIAGFGGSSRWCILAQSIYITSTNMSGGNEKFKDEASIVSSGLEAVLDGTMNLGIYHADRGSVVVGADGSFTAPLSKRLAAWGANSKIHGRFHLSENSRLDGATWQITSKPGFIFYVKYDYKGEKTNTFPPKKWYTWGGINGKLAGTNWVEILKIEKAMTKQSESEFLPEKFINDTNKPPFGPIVVLPRFGGQGVNA
jgi:hypothetical protein